MLDTLINEIVVQCKSHVKNALSPIPIAESVAILNSINCELVNHIPTQNLDVSTYNVMTIVAQKLSESDIKLRWSLDRTLIWDIR